MIRVPRFRLRRPTVRSSPAPSAHLRVPAKARRLRRRRGAAGGRGPGGRGGDPTVPVTVGAGRPEVDADRDPRDRHGRGVLRSSPSTRRSPGSCTEVNFKEGDDVAKGQVLFALDRRPLEAALLQAQANLQRDIAQAANAQVAGPALSGSRRARHRHDANRSTRAEPAPRRSRRRSKPIAPRSRTPRCSCSTRRSRRRLPGAPAR